MLEYMKCRAYLLVSDNYFERLKDFSVKKLYLTQIIDKKQSF